MARVPKANPDVAKAVINFIFIIVGCLSLSKRADHRMLIRLKYMRAAPVPLRISPKKPGISSTDLCFTSEIPTGPLPIESQYLNHPWCYRSVGHQLHRRPVARIRILESPNKTHKCRGCPPGDLLSNLRTSSLSRSGSLPRQFMGLFL